jgi:hypothetical protein
MRRRSSFKHQHAFQRPHSDHHSQPCSRAVALRPCDEEYNSNEGDANTNCGICLEKMVDAFELDCKHSFCRGCVHAYKRHGVNNACLYCRAPLPPGTQEFVKRHGICSIESNSSARAARCTWRWRSSRRCSITQTVRSKRIPTILWLAMCLASGVSEDVDGAERQYHESIHSL